MDEGMNYPLHLGVTEAGEGEDGRIKSSIGIGSLLEDGIGDTIRVSLTEEPEEEIPVASLLVSRYEITKDTPDLLPELQYTPYDPFFYKKRVTDQIINLGGQEVPRVIGDLSSKKIINPSDLGQFGYLYSEEKDKWYISDQAIDYLFVGSQNIDFALPSSLKILCDLPHSVLRDDHYPIITVDQITEIQEDTIFF